MDEMSTDKKKKKKKNSITPKLTKTKNIQMTGEKCPN